MDEDNEQEFRLCVRYQPWQATLQRLPAHPGENASPEQFDSPLELIDRLEQTATPHNGLK